MLIAVGAVVVALIAAGAALLATGGNTSGGSSATSPAAAQLLDAALGAAHRAGSFHYVSTYTSQGITQHTVGDAGPNSGRQVITIGPHTFTVVVLGTTCFFQGDAEALASQLLLSPAAAAAHAGQWISLAPHDGPYAVVYAAVTAPSALADNIAFRPQQDLGSSTIGDRRVTAIRGAMTNVTVDGQTEHARGTAELATTSSSPHLPVQYVEHGRIDGQATDFVMSFSRWGKPVVVVAPPSALSFSSLGPGATSSPPGSTSLV